MKNIFIILVSLSLSACAQNKTTNKEANITNKENMNKPIEKTEEEWKQLLTPEQYSVLREKGTEKPFSGKYNNHKAKGIYSCAACNAELFRSDTKFDAHCGWPSFYEALDKSKIIEKRDLTNGMVRIEVMCANCGGHLGHVFDDGPKPTGMRYCINSVSIDFKEEK